MALIEADTRQTAQRTRNALGTSGGVALALGVALGIWVFARGNGPFPLDGAWNSFLAEAGWDAAVTAAQVLNTLGGVVASSLVVPVVVIGALLIVGWRREAVLVAVAIATSALAVQVLKHTVGRARPEEVLVFTDVGSYPSGHVANAATLAVLLAVLVPRWWALVVGVLWVLAMALSRTVVHAHWLSDTLGGTLVGAGVALAVCALFVRASGEEQRHFPHGS